MKNLLPSALLACLISFVSLMASAATPTTGKVYSLNPGQTLPLSDGSVVACMDPNSAPTPPPPVYQPPVHEQRLYRCKVMPQGSPILNFCGVSTSEESALTQARANCMSSLASNPVRMQFCGDRWYNYSCKQIDAVDAGNCY